MLAAALAGDNPRPIHKRWLMPHMLAMAAGQIGHPVALFILMIADNGLVHDVLERRLFAINLNLPFLKRHLWTLRSGEIGPPFLAVHVETPQKHDLPIEMAKF